MSSLPCNVVKGLNPFHKGGGNNNTANINDPFADTVIMALPGFEETAVELSATLHLHAARRNIGAAAVIDNDNESLSRMDEVTRASRLEQAKKMIKPPLVLLDIERWRERLLHSQHQQQQRDTSTSCAASASASATDAGSNATIPQQQPQQQTHTQTQLSPENKATLDAYLRLYRSYERNTTDNLSGDSDEQKDQDSDDGDDGNRNSNTITATTTTNFSHFETHNPNVILDVKHIQGKDVVLLAECDNSDLLSYFSIVYAVPRYLARTFLVVTPFFPTGTMERVMVEGEVATAKTLVRMMDIAPQPVVGQTTYMFFDIHALATRFFFGDGIKALFVSAVQPLLLDYLKKEYGGGGNVGSSSCSETATGGNGGDTTNARGSNGNKKLLVCFPDEGAKKRFSNLVFTGSTAADLFDKENTVVCSKTRVGDRRELIIAEGPGSGSSISASGTFGAVAAAAAAGSVPAGGQQQQAALPLHDRDVLIIDDLVNSGGTLIECVKLLQKNGARRASIFVTHGVFGKQSWRRFEAMFAHQRLQKQQQQLEGSNWDANSHRQEKGCREQQLQELQKQQQKQQQYMKPGDEAVRILHHFILTNSVPSVTNYLTAHRVDPFVVLSLGPMLADMLAAV